MTSELIGGVRNAMERQETMDKIRQTFLNAGYSREEIEQAIKELSTQVVTSSSNSTIQNSPSPQPVQSMPTPTSPQPPIAPQNTQFQKLPATTQTSNTSSSGASTKLWIILAIVSVLILAGAALLGIFWTKVSSMLGLS